MEINLHFNMLRAAVQQIADDMDLLSYAKNGGGVCQLPCYVVDKVKTAEDKQALIDATEKDPAQAIGYAESLMDKVIKGE